MKMRMRKRKTGILILCFTLALSAAIFFPSANKAVKAEGTAALYNTAGRAYASMQEFFKDGQNRDRLTGTEGAKKTAEWIAARFNDLSLEDPVIKSKPDDPKYIKNFELTYGGSFFQQETSKPAFNVAGRIKADGLKKTVIIGANYDNTYGLQYMQGYHNKSEGALDNASGVAAMLAIAEAAVENKKAGIEIDYNLMFVAFGANNDGFYGSAKFVAEIDKYGLSLSDIALMINLSCVAGGDKLYMYCDEVETLHEKHFKAVADGQTNNAFALNLPPKNKKIVPDAYSSVLYTHKGLEGDHYVFWNNDINTVNLFGYNWDINAAGNTESAAGSIAGTDGDTWENLFTYYENGKAMMDSAVNIVTGVLYDGGTSETLSLSHAEKYDYRAFLANPLYSFLYQMVALIGLCVLLIVLYSRGIKYTPKVIIQKYSTKVSVFGDEYEEGGGSQPPPPDENPFN